MRREGHSWQAIASRLGYSSPSSAYNAFKTARDRNLSGDLEELRALENDRLDMIQYSLWDRAVSGDLKALDLVLKVIDRRCRLNGLYAPLRVAAQTVNESYDSWEISAELAHLLKLLEEHPRGT
jgi:hypothetical protein